MSVRNPDVAALRRLEISTLSSGSLAICCSVANST
jgi:hypothetical protein